MNRFIRCATALTLAAALPAGAGNGDYFARNGQESGPPKLLQNDEPLLGKPVNDHGQPGNKSGPTPGTDNMQASGGRKGPPTPGTDNQQAGKSGPPSEAGNLQGYGDNKSGPTPGTDNMQASGGHKGPPTPGTDNQQASKSGPPSEAGNLQGYGDNKSGPTPGTDNMQASGGGNHAKDGQAGNANQDYPYLTDLDASMAPNHNPPGAPKMPSQCAENAGCRPCFEQANAGLDTQRRNLEKVRAIYDYTHRIVRNGTELMYAAGAAGGGVSHMGAVAEVQKVEGALDQFDATVHQKNAELLGKLKGSLQELAQCEARYFDNDDWYVRYGEVYYQFMQGRYSF